jgi:hypothetical protein
MLKGEEEGRKEFGRRDFCSRKRRGNSRAVIGLLQSQANRGYRTEGDGSLESL